MGFSIIKIYAKTVHYSWCGWRLIAFFYFIKKGMEIRLLGLRQSEVLTCANSSVEVIEPDTCLSVEIFFRVISQREMEELEMNMDWEGTPTRQAVKTLLFQKHWLEVENLTWNILFYCSSCYCKIGKYSILSQHPQQSLSWCSLDVWQSILWYYFPFNLEITIISFPVPEEVTDFILKEKKYTMRLIKFRINI